MLRTIPFLVWALVVVVTSSARAVEVGDTVLAYWPKTKLHFIGTAVEKAEAGYLIVFEDGDRGVVPEDKIRKYDIKVGTPVLARFTDGKGYRGKVEKTVGRAFYIRYDDGDKAWVPWSWVAVE